MSKVITFSSHFPKSHPKAGQPTYFVNKIWGYFLHKSSPMFPYWMKNHPCKIDIRSCYDFEPKYHTIRAGSRWKVGDKFSPRVWSGKPYASKQIVIASDIEVKKVWDFSITTEDDDGEHDWSFVEFLGKTYTCYGYGGYDEPLMVEIAKNDGLSITDFYDWFLNGRTKQQRLNNEPKIFKGQIICWSDDVCYC